MVFFEQEVLELAEKCKLHKGKKAVSATDNGMGEWEVEFDDGVVDTFQEYDLEFLMKQ